MILKLKDSYFTFFHKVFFQQLVNDWSSRFMGDLRKFVPYIYDIKLKATDLEVILPCNQYNWIDVTILENNAFFEVLAKNARLDLAFKFEDFLPENMKIPMDVNILDACARFFVPPTNMNLALMKILRKNLKYISIENGIQTQFDKKRWSKFNKIVNVANSNSSSNNNEQTETVADINAALNIDENSQEQYKQPPGQSIKASFSSSNKHSASKQKMSNSKNKKNLKPENETNSYNNNKNNRKNQTNQNETQLDFSENWFECWHADYVSVIMDYDYNPCPILDWNLKSNNF